MFALSSPFTLSLRRDLQLRHGPSQVTATYASSPECPSPPPLPSLPSPPSLPMPAQRLIETGDGEALPLWSQAVLGVGGALLLACTLFICYVRTRVGGKCGCTVPFAHMLLQRPPPGSVSALRVGSACAMPRRPRLWRAGCLRPVATPQASER